MTSEELPVYIALETTTSQGKENWAIWQRDTGSTNYSYLVARVYDRESTNLIVALLNLEAARKASK